MVSVPCPSHKVRPVLCLPRGVQVRPSVVPLPPPSPLFIRQNHLFVGFWLIWVSSSPIFLYPIPTKSLLSSLPSNSPRSLAVILFLFLPYLPHFLPNLSPSLCFSSSIFCLSVPPDLSQSHCFSAPSSGAGHSPPPLKGLLLL